MLHLAPYSDPSLLFYTRHAFRTVLLPNADTIRLWSGVCLVERRLLFEAPIDHP